MILHAKKLLIEMREYTKNKIRNADLPLFVPSTEEPRKLYNKVSCIDMSLYADDAVIKALKKMITDESLDFSAKSRAIAEISAKEVEKLNKNSTDKDKQKVTDMLVSDKQKIIDLATVKIDKVYDNLVDAVDRHPELADAILKLSETFSKNFNAILDNIIQYIREIIKNLVSIGKTIWEMIANTFKKIVENINKWFSE